MSKLKRTLSLSDAVFSGIGIILGAGIYALIGGATGMTGNSVWLSFLIAAFIASLTGLSYAELATIFPKSAAEYSYVKNSLESHLVAFLVGWLEIFAGLIGTATVALAFGGYFSSMLGGSPIVISVVLIGVMGLINFVGIRESSRFNVIFTLIEVFGLVLIIVMGINYLGSVDYLELAYGIPGLFKAVGIVFFAYLGFQEIANIAEEVKNPEKNLPKAIIISVVISTIIYALVALSVVSVGDWQIIGNSPTPLSYVTEKVLGKTGGLVMSSIALFATANTVLIFLLVVSRMTYGMSRGGSLPKFLSTVNSKTKTPGRAILISVVITILFVLIGDIVTVASLVDFSIFLIFVFVNLSLIVLRYKRPDIKRVFKVPLNIGKFSVISFLGLIFSFFMLFHFEVKVFLITAIISLVGYIIYKIGN
jgi:APA family basic amino acid/polyamine antiporter